MYKEIKSKINESDMVLICLGQEAALDVDNEELFEIMNKLAEELDHHNYFIVATMKNDILRSSKLNQKRIVYPYKVEQSQLEEKQWDLYNKWLSATLAKKLVMIEIGEGFLNPNVVRWPFERITMINNTAFLYRINSEFSQIPSEIHNKAESINKNAFEFLKELLNH